MSEKLKIATVGIGSIIANPKNARSHPDEQIQHLVASIKRFGQPRPILVRKENKMIVGGHGIFTACKLAGLEHVSAILWDVDQATADAYMLADNRLGDLSTDDEDRVAALLREINADDYFAIGFDDTEVSRLLDELEEDAIEVEELSADLVSDSFWITIRGPLANQAAALDRLKAAMVDLEDVDVELGTTPGM